jgi:prolyl 4-hydroxylase
MDGQKYDAHWDWFDDPLHGHGKDTEADNRVATVLLYLGEVEEGGETSLPLAELIDPKRQLLVRPSECAKKGTLAVRPKKGDALLFWDILPDGKVVDRAALHASCPTLKGTKWTATKWWVAGGGGDRCGYCCTVCRDVCLRVPACCTATDGMLAAPD